MGFTPCQLLSTHEGDTFMKNLPERRQDYGSRNSQDSTKVAPPPCYSLFGYLYPGIDIDDEGIIDLRIRFAIPFNIDVTNFRVTYMVFPYGSSTSEFIDKEL